MFFRMAPTVRHMALLHRANLNPTKLELLGPWLATRSWYQGPVRTELLRTRSFRFDDPAGEVGIETHLVRSGTAHCSRCP